VRCLLRLSDFRGSEKLPTDFSISHRYQIFIQVFSAVLRLLKFGQTVAKMRDDCRQRFIADTLGMEDDCSRAAGGQ
jgi:hypothetical protein